MTCCPPGCPGQRGAENVREHGDSARNRHFEALPLVAETRDRHFRNQHKISLPHHPYRMVSEFQSSAAGRFRDIRDELIPGEILFVTH